MALKATPQNLTYQPVVEFRPDDLNSAIWVKGYLIRIDKSHRCPCESKDGISLSSCQNCQGTGYFYFNAIDTMGLVTGINKNTQFKEWSVENIGTISLSVRDMETNTEEKIAFYDRVTLLQRRADQAKVFGFHTEVLELRDGRLDEQNEPIKFVFMAYSVQEIIDVFYFDSPTTPLVRFEGAIIKNGNKYVIEFPGLPVVTNRMVSVRYKHDIQYHVIDIPHEVRHSTTKNSDGRLETTTLPINAICRRAHLVQVQRTNFDGTGIIDNT